MRWIFKWLLRLVVVLVVLIILAVMLKDVVLRRIMEERIHAQTGLGVEIRRLSTGIFSPVVTMEGLKLYNTADFGGTPLLDMPEFHVELDSAALARRQVHVTLARFNLAEVDIVRNELGQTNLVTLMGKAQARVEKDGGIGKALGQFEFTGVDVLNLSLGTVKYIDLADRANNREVHINLQNQVFKNLKNKTDLQTNLILLWLSSGGRIGL
ncbi:MAG: hypothetical protein U1F98_06830 [Verrucomicrobiota bacterium]